MTQVRKHQRLKIDKRTARGKRWLQLRQQFLDEINGGQMERLSEVTKLKLHTLCDVALMLEVSRAKQVSGDVVDPAILNRLSRTFMKLTSDLGLEE